MVDAFRIRSYGDASELKLKRDIDIGAPKDYEILIKHRALGVNRFDLEAIGGKHSAHVGKKLPFIPGTEVIGTVEKIGRGVANFAVGSRVACCASGFGGLAEKSIVHMKQCVFIPNSINDEIAAAGYLKSSIAMTLLTRAFSAYADSKIVVFGASGGVGHMLTQLAKSGECNIIGIASSPERAQIALENGCNKTFILDDPELTKKIIHYFGGHGAHAVFDPICSALTSKIALDALAEFGMYVPYGYASGENPRISIARMSSKSLYVTRPNMFHYQSTRLALQATASRVFELMQNGTLKPKITDVYAFKHIARAYKSLEDREVTGSSIISIA